MVNLFFFLANDKIESDHLSLHIKQINFYVIENIFMLEKGANCNFIVCLILKYMNVSMLYLTLKVKNANF